MKKVSLLCVSLLMFGLCAMSQPTQITFADFESGIPAGWTASNNVQVVTSLASRGQSSVRLRNNNNSIVTLTSPSFTHTVGCNVRLEFSHIPMLQNQLGAGQVQISTDNGTTWMPLSSTGSPTSPTGYDCSYGGGVGRGANINFNGNFAKIYYWDGNQDIPEANLDNSYWRHEIFYLQNTLGDAPSYKIRFCLPATTTANTFAGWFIDDFRIYQASAVGNTVRVPQLASLPKYPNIYNYPNCSDAEIVAEIRFLQSSPPTVADSIYLEYILGSSTTTGRTTMTYDATVNPPVYRGLLPFNGFDSITKWRIVMNDGKYNRLTYPFVLGKWNEFRSVRGYVGEQPMQTTGLSSQELMVKTNTIRNVYQFRYRASELRALGIRPGKIGGLKYNVTQAASGFTMLGFNLYIANIDSTVTLSPSYQYAGSMTQVIGPGFNLVSPQIGWQYLSFNSPFLWDGVSDILIKDCWDNGSGAIGGTTKIESINAPGSTGTIGTPGYIPSAQTGQAYQTSTNTTGCDLPFNTADGWINYRPNFKFSFVNDCQLAIDAGINSRTPDAGLNDSADFVVTANSPSQISVRLKNYGSNPLTTVKINYKVDNASTVSPGNWTGMLNSGDSVIYNFTNSFLPGFRYMKVWSEILPPDIDWEKDNDTAYFGIVACNGPMNGEYAIGTISGVSADRTFNNFKEVFKMLKGCGVSGPVTFKVLNLAIGQYYTDTLSFPKNITGASSTNYIKFISASTTNAVNMKPPRVANYNINLSGDSYYKFENIAFYSADGCLNDTICGLGNIIQMSSSTSNIEFKKCKFIKNPNGRVPTYMFNIGSANNITIDSCTFDGDASAQVYVKGSSTNNLCNNNIIRNSTFINNLNNAIYAEYSQNLLIEKNTFKNNRTYPAGSIYNVLIQTSKDFKIVRNLFELNNVSAIIASDVLTSLNPSIIANNKISVHNGNTGASTTNVYGINLTSGSNILIAYNNIYARDLGSSVVSYGINLGLGPTQSLTSVRIKNNIVVSDGSGYAIYARPSTATSLDFSNNIYYKCGTMVTTPGTIIWKYNTTNCTTLAAWQTALGSGDQNSYLQNPIFTDWNALNTSNTFLCYKATYLTEVTNDFNNAIRPTSDNPCIGAVQFNPPPSNIFVQKVWIDRGDESTANDGNTRYSACGLGDEYINIRYTNISSNAIPANNLQFWYKIDNTTIPVAQKDTIHNIVQPNTVYNYRFRNTYNFGVTSVDRDFKLTAFSVLAADTVRTNDTSACYVLSRQQLTALPAHNDTINYGDSIRLSVVSTDSIYYFLNNTDATPALKSHFYQTSRLFGDTTFYFSRKEEIPMLKISEVMISKLANATGQTANLPSWVTATNAIELSNYGNGAINLKGLQLAYIIGTRTNSDSLVRNVTKSTVFGNYILPPSKSVVIQFSTGTTQDSSKYLFAGSGTAFNATSKVGIFIKDSVTNTVIDALTINNARFDTIYHIPSSIWSGLGIYIPNGTAGLIRTNRSAIDSNGWAKSTSTNLMTIGSFDSTQVWKYDNGCYGFMSPYNVHVSGVPSVDPGVASIKLVGINESSVCTLTNEHVQVRVTNTGVQPCSSTPLALKVYDGSTLVNTYFDTCNITILPNDTVTYTLSQTVNLAANTSNKTFNLVCYSNLSTDVIHLNDTASMQITSLKTPYSPISLGSTIPYASSANLTATLNGGNNSDVLIWYNDPTTPVELSRVSYTTPILYTTDTFYVGTMLMAYDTIQLGNATTSNAATSYPCPLNPYLRNVKEQYLFKASELSNLGFTEGNINSLMFNIVSITRADTLNNYTIKIGYTNEESLNTWQYGLTEVYNNTLYCSTQTGWKTFPFSEPFYYDGHSNIVVEICFSSASNSNNARVSTYYTATPFNSVLSYRHATTNACSWTGAPISGGATLRPNICFDIDKFGCSSVRTPVTVTVGAPPTCDASISQITSPSTTTVMSGISIPIQVELKNYGSQALTSTDIAWVVNGVAQTTYNWTGNLAPGATTNVLIGNKIFVSGNNNITAWTILACDTIHHNDTTSFNFSSCIGNNTSTSHVTVGGTTAEFPTITSAVSALINSGICGDVVFDINPINGGYNEQIYIPSITGTENGSTITFRGNATDSNTVILKYNSGTNTDKFALKLDGTSNIKFENLTIENYSNTSPSLVEITNNSSNITFESVVLKSSLLSTPAQEVAKLVNIIGANNNITFNKDYFSGGAIGINSNLPTDTVSNNIVITNSFFNYFGFNGISFDGANNILIKNNKFREYANGNISKAISSTYLYGTVEISSNDIYLEGGTAVRAGIDIRKINASINSPVLIANNSISLSGTYSTSAIAYVGLNLDTVNNCNVYYNTIKVRASANSSSSKTLNIGSACSGIKVLNNNLENAGKGFAYYVFAPTTQVTLSNNNNYFSNGNAPIFWSSNKNSLALLQTANSQDNLSLMVGNPFISDSLLSPSYPSDIVRAGEPLDDVTSDILGNYRPISPKPTIGAYEYQFDNVDCGPIEILSPLRTIKYIENQPLNVQVRVKNFGLFALDTVRITAVLRYKADTTHIIQTVSQSFVFNLNSLSYSDFTISDPLFPPLHFRSLTDSLNLTVYTTLNGDTNKINDTIRMNFLTIPGYNLQTVRTEPITQKCQLYSTPVKMTIKNIGEISILPTDSIWVGYQVTGRPDLEARELLRFPYDDENGHYDSLQKNGQIIYTFNQRANFYPLGLVNTTWNLRTYASIWKDNVKTNDTSAYITVNARVSPPAPITYDTAINYGTWAEPRAEQINSLPIKWYSDSTNTDPFYAPSNYNASTKYRTTQLFTDSIYYLRVNLAGSDIDACKSYFTPLRVTQLDRSAADGACIGLQGQGVVEPPQEGWVYMTNADTIKVKISNYGIMDMQNFNVTYSIQMTSPATSPITYVTEHCTSTIPPNGSFIYKFDSLADFSNPSKNYRIRAWVDVPGEVEATHINDTSVAWIVRPRNGNIIYPPSSATNANSLDITRVQLGNMDNSSNNSGVAYSDYTSSIPPAVLFKGIYDSIYVQCDKPSNVDDTSRIGGWVRAFIDWNRDGAFNGPSEEVLNDTIWSGSIAKGKINVPTSFINGYTRMRVILWQGKNSEPFTGADSPTAGEVEDYKVLIRDTWPVNAELMKFTSPNEFLTEQTNDIKVVLRNTGKTNLTSATIHLTNNDGPEEIINWAGNLAPAARTEVTLLANTTIPTGMNKFKAWVDAQGDPYHNNDTIRRSSYIFKTYTLPYACNFDEGGYDDFYAYNNNPQLPTNCWEFGTPDTTNIVIKRPYSAPNCWKTKLSGRYPANNESILYSPIFNIGIVKPDTLAFMMRKSLSAGSYMYVEYLNWNNKWARLGTTDDDWGQNWYNGDSNRFTSQTGEAWKLRTYSLDHIGYNLGNTLQFRFIFHSASSVDDGIAIDNMELRRALRAKDAGITNIAITPSEMPNYGTYYYPEVTIRNYGSEDLTVYDACYTAQDMFIEKCEQVLGRTIHPGDTIHYTFHNGRYVNVNMSNPFQICAFTRLNPTDLYSDNDSTCRQVVIGPLQKDVALLDIVTPTTQIVSNNMIDVSIHIKNMGLDRVTTLPVGYKVTGQNQVLETITFSPPLSNGEEYIYHFNTQYLSSYGSSNLKVWTGLEGDYYHDNDTLYRRTQAATTTKDIEAKYITIDDYNADYLGVQLSFVNNSSVGVNDITVGYYYNGDKANAVEETYRVDDAGVSSTVPSGTYGHHYFAATLPRANAPYQEICGYVRVTGDNNNGNDTTCVLYMGVRDAKSDTIYIEQTPDAQSKVQLRARNVGTIGGPITVNAGYVINGDWSHPTIQAFNWPFNEPNATLINYLTFTNKIPRRDDSVYNIVAWVDYQYDANRSNDTTSIYKVVGHIGLPDEIETNQFTLDQNVPNPLNNSTRISFNLPTAGNTRFFIVNNMGQLIKNENKFYSEGKHEIYLNNLNLPQGMYYYVMEFNGKRITKKMVISK